MPKNNIVRDADQPGDMFTVKWDEFIHVMHVMPQNNDEYYSSENSVFTNEAGLYLVLCRVEVKDTDDGALVVLRPDGTIGYVYDTTLFRTRTKKVQP